MVGSIIGGALQLGSSIYGAVAGANAMDKYRKYLDRKEAQNQAWYDRRYNERATERADAQYMLNKLNEGIKARNRSASGTAAVMGTTSGEQVAAQKEANNEAMAEAAARIAAQGDARKDAIEQRYMATRDSLESSRAGLEMQRSQNIANAVKGAAKVGSTIAGMADDYLPKTKAPDESDTDAGSGDSGAPGDTGDTGSLDDPNNVTTTYYNNQYYA